MGADVGVTDKPRPLLPAACLIDWRQLYLVQTIRINVPCRSWDTRGQSSETTRKQAKKDRDRCKQPSALVDPQPVVTQDQLLSSSSSSSGTQTGATLEPEMGTVTGHSIQEVKLESDRLFYYWILPERWDEAESGQTLKGSCRPLAGRRPRPQGWTETKRSGGHGLRERPRPLLLWGEKSGWSRGILFCSFSDFVVIVVNALTWHCSVWQSGPSGDGSGTHCNSGFQRTADWPARARRRGKTLKHSPRVLHHSGMQQRMQGLEHGDSWSLASCHTCPLSYTRVDRVRRVFTNSLSCTVRVVRCWIKHKLWCQNLQLCRLRIRCFDHLGMKQQSLIKTVENILQVKGNQSLIQNALRMLDIHVVCCWILV